MIKILKFSIILLFVVNIFFVSALIINAEGLLPEESEKSSDCNSTNCGDYTLNDMAMTAKNVSNFILGIVGSVSLLAFVIGGLMWIFSGGNTEWVNRGKQTIIGAVIGLAVVFASYIIIYAVFKSLGVSAPLNSTWFTSGWFK